MPEQQNNFETPRAAFNAGATNESLVTASVHQQA
jgi:hypothetical protein